MVGFVDGIAEGWIETVPANDGWDETVGLGLDDGANDGRLDGDGDGTDDGTEE